ncbi:MAG: RES domain-containing protein [Gaiellaceae bacterium]
MALWFRQADARYAFLHESPLQEPGRWHGAGEGPAQYFADTPDGAWAEHIRHEQLRDPERIAASVRILWAVDIDEEAETIMRPRLHRLTLIGSTATYSACRAAARRLRRRGATALLAPSAALREGGARGQNTRDAKLVGATPREGRVLVLFGARPNLRAWACGAPTHATGRLLPLVRQL